MPRNTKVALNFSIRDGNDMKICVESLVIVRIQLDNARGVYTCTQTTAASYVPAPRVTSGALGSETCAARTGMHRYLMEARPSLSGTANKCMTLDVYTTDGFVQQLELRFTN